MAAVAAMEGAVEVQRAARIVNPGMGDAWKPLNKELRTARAALHDAKKHNRGSVPALEKRLLAAQKACNDAKDAFLRQTGRDVQVVKADVSKIKTDVVEVKTSVVRVEGKVDALQTMLHRLNERLDERDVFDLDRIALLKKDKSPAEQILAFRMATQRNHIAANEVRAKVMAEAQEAKKLAAEQRAREKLERETRAAEAKAAKEAERAAKAEATAKRKAEALAASEASRN